MTKRSADVVLETIRDLCAQGEIATREAIRNATGLPMTTVDDRVSYLIDRDLVVRVRRGVFVLAPDWYPRRSIRKTMTADGAVTIEIGDQYILRLVAEENLALTCLPLRTQLARHHLMHDETAPRQLIVRPRTPGRDIKLTLLDDGRVQIEIGDCVVELAPNELRVLA